MAIRREDERHVEPLRGRVELRLLEAVGRGEMSRLGLDQRHRHALGAGVDLGAKDVVGPSLRPASGLAVDDLDRARGLLPADEVLGPAARVERVVDELGSGIGLAQVHGPACPP